MEEYTKKELAQKINLFYLNTADKLEDETQQFYSAKAWIHIWTTYFYVNRQLLEENQIDTLVFAELVNFLKENNFSERKIKSLSGMFVGLSKTIDQHYKSTTPDEVYRLARYVVTRAYAKDSSTLTNALFKSIENTVGYTNNLLGFVDNKIDSPHIDQGKNARKKAIEINILFLRTIIEFDAKLNVEQIVKIWSLYFWATFDILIANDLDEKLLKELADYLIKSNVPKGKISKYTDIPLNILKTLSNKHNVSSGDGLMRAAGFIIREVYGYEDAILAITITESLVSIIEKTAPIAHGQPITRADIERANKLVEREMAEEEAEAAGLAEENFLGGELAERVTGVPQAKQETRQEPEREKNPYPAVDEGDVGFGEGALDEMPDTDPADRFRKQRFCTHCGSIIDAETKKCTGCGKQYFHLSKSTAPTKTKDNHAHTRTKRIAGIICGIIFGIICAVVLIYEAVESLSATAIENLLFLAGVVSLIYALASLLKNLMSIYYLNHPKKDPFWGVLVMLLAYLLYFIALPATLVFYGLDILKCRVWEKNKMEKERELQQARKQRYNPDKCRWKDDALCLLDFLEHLTSQKKSLSETNYQSIKDLIDRGIKLIDRGI